MKPSSAFAVAALNSTRIGVVQIATQCSSCSPSSTDSHLHVDPNKQDPTNPCECLDHRDGKINADITNFENRSCPQSPCLHSWSSSSQLKSQLATLDREQSLTAPAVAHLGSSLHRKFVAYGNKHACSLQLPCSSGKTVKSRAIGRENKNVRALYDEGRLKDALRVLSLMNHRDARAISVSYVHLLQICGDRRALADGKQVHAQLIKQGFESDIYVANTLVSMYAKCGNLADAHQVFDSMVIRDVVSWTAMIAGYAKQQNSEESFKLFHRMKQAGIKPNRVTFVCILSACSSVRALELGKQIHFEIIEAGVEAELNVGTALVDMYAKCGDLLQAQQIFDQMPSPNVASWNAIITGYAQHKNGMKALQLWQKMKSVGLKPDVVTYVCILNSCGTLATFKLGKHVHDDVVEAGLESDNIIANALIDMYAKCGSLVSARQIFDKMPLRNVISWNAMIVGYSMHGDSEQAFDLFRKMLDENFRPDHVTFVAMLSVCSHQGLQEEGLRFFESMKKDYGLMPGLKHYGCMVDLLGRAGLLNEAYDLVKEMTLPADVALWRALLSACRVHGNSVLAERVAKHILELDPKNAAAHVLLSNIYAASNKQDEYTKLRNSMNARRVNKVPGCCWIEVGNTLHAFNSEDTSHPFQKEIYLELSRLCTQMKKTGYVPDTQFVLHNSDEDKKEFSVLHHSEKLAIAFGLITTAPGTPIYIVKNLRFCGDCHSASKYISKICEREIIARDAHRFHHFHNGVCSCGDYW